MPYCATQQHLNIPSVLVWVCRSKAYSLFKFEGSYHAMTMNSYLMEQAAGQGGVDALDAGLSVTGEWFPSSQLDILI